MPPAWYPDSRYVRRYNPRRVETITGRIVSIGTFHPERGAPSGLAFRMRTRSGRILLVQAGPKPFIDHLGVRLHRGERVVVTGSLVSLAGRPILMARELETSRGDYRLRATDGWPLWSGPQIGYRGPYSR